MVRIGVLSFHNSKETKSILNCIEKLGHTPVWLRKSNLKIKIDSDEIKIEPDVDIVINRLLFSKSEQPVQLLGILKAISDTKIVLNDCSGILKSANKVTSTAIMSNISNVKIPESLFGSVSDMNEYYNTNPNSILKRSIGTHGNTVSRIEDKGQIFSDINGSYTLIQEEIKQNKKNSDVRCYIVGGEVVSSMRRIAGDNEWRANIARGGIGEKTKLSEDIKEKSIKVFEKHDLDFAGIDLMRDEDGEWRFLEVNPTAGFKGLYEATKKNPSPYIIKLALKKLDEKISDDKIENLSQELDDSLPDCKPPYGFSTKPEIGFEEKVWLSGSKDSKNIKCKIDTGAKRTSIDTELASEIGTGNIEDVSKVRSGSNKDVTKRPVVNCTIKLKELEHNTKVSIEDRSHMNYKVIIGRDILQHYKINPNINSLKETEIEE
jgi:RimK family alpha-L-glutamate ligase